MVFRAFELFEGMENWERWQEGGVASNSEVWRVWLWEREEQICQENIGVESKVDTKRDNY